MAIVKLKPDAPIPGHTTIPEQIREPEKSTFTALVPESRSLSLLKYTEGFPWTVNYYGQILNENNTLTNFDPSLDNFAQSYYLVKESILRVTSPLSSNYDESNGVTSIEGSSTAPLGLRPNTGDVFLATVDSGEDAIFIVNSVTRKTHRKDTLYEINYSLFAYTTDEPTFLPSLSQRVNETYFYNKDSNFFNRDVLITPKVKEYTDLIRSFSRTSKDTYFKIFSQKSVNTIVIPGLYNIFYDPLLAEFIFKTVETDDIYPNKFHLYTYEAQELENESILSSMIKRSVPTQSTERNYTFVSTSALLKSTKLGTLQFSGITYILFPDSADMSRLTPTRPGTGLDKRFDIRTSENYETYLGKISVTANNNGVFETNILPDIFVDNTYIVSSGFYDYIKGNKDESEMSFLEILLARYLKREAVTRYDLYKLIETYEDWPLLYKFYYTPIIWLMIKVVIGD